MVREIIETIGAAGAGKAINIAEDYIASMTGMPLSPWISIFGGAGLIAFGKYKARGKAKNIMMIAGATAAINKTIDLLTRMIALPVVIPVAAGLAPIRFPARAKYAGMID